MLLYDKINQIEFCGQLVTCASERNILLYVIFPLSTIGLSTERKRKYGFGATEPECKERFDRTGGQLKNCVSSYHDGVHRCL